jgi:hypothetical protein
MSKRKGIPKKRNEKSVDEILKEDLLSAIGNREPFHLIWLVTHDFSSIEAMKEKFVGSPMLIYRQGAMGEIKQVICAHNGEDMLSLFKRELENFEQQLKSCGNELPLAVKNFEVMKVLNYCLEEVMETTVVHVVFSEQDAELLLYESELVMAHWEEAYSKIKGIRLSIGEESLPSDGEGEGPTFH